MHKRVLGTRRVSGNSLVAQSASITTRDQPLHFSDTANFALIRCNAPLLQAKEGSHLSDLFFSILQTNAHLDGLLFGLLGSDVAELSTVLGERVAQGAGTRVSNYVNPMHPNDEPDQPAKRVDCTFSSQRVRAHGRGLKKEEVKVSSSDEEESTPLVQGKKRKTTASPSGTERKRKAAKAAKPQAAEEGLMLSSESVSDLPE